MRKSPWHSLRARIIIGVMLPLLVGVFVSYLARYQRYQRGLMENLQRQAADSGRIVMGSLQYAMSSNDFDTVQQIVDDIGSERGVRDLFLLANDGTVLISTGDPAPGIALDRSHATCVTCHQGPVTLRVGSVVLALEDGTRLFRSVSVVENKPEC